MQHLSYTGGPSEAYHLTITLALPAFDVSLGIDRYDVAPGSFVPVGLLVNRRGYTGAIDVTAEGQAYGMPGEHFAARQPLQPVRRTPPC